MEPVFSSADLAAKDQFDGFSEAIRAAVVSVNPRRLGNGPYSSQIKQQSVERLRFTEIKCDPVMVERSDLQIASDTDESYFVLIQVAGQTLVSQSDRHLMLKPGDFTLIDNLSPYSLACSVPIHRLLLRVPRRDLEARIGSCSHLSATRFSSRRKSAFLALEFLKLVARNAEGLDRSDVHEFSELALDVLATAIKYGSALEYRDNKPSQSTLISRIKGFMETNLCEPDLLPANIAVAHGISTRYLHKLFNESGQSVCQWIREQRLARCYLELCDPLNARLTITEIAFRNGFNDASHFSRTFKDRFGKTPRSVRGENCRPS